MIELNTQRQNMVEDFVLDLEGMLTKTQLDKIDRLWTPLKSPKKDAKDFAKKQAKYEAGLREAQQQLGYLARNRLKLRVNIGVINEEQWKWLLKRRLTKIDSMAELVRVYRRRQPDIAALDQRITKLDQLIDQIVYALYGLEKEEISIVESSITESQEIEDADLE